MPKQPRRSEYIDRAVVAALRDIHVVESALAALEYATRVANIHQSYGDTPVSREQSMRSYLWQKKSEAMARAMMFGSLTLNDDLRREAISKATEFVVRENSSIMGYLEMTGITPGTYLSDVNVEFHQQIRAAVADITGTDRLDDEVSPLDAAYDTIEQLKAEIAVLRSGSNDTPEVPSQDA